MCVVQLAQDATAPDLQCRNVNYLVPLDESAHMCHNRPDTILQPWGVVVGGIAAGRRLIVKPSVRRPEGSPDPRFAHAVTSIAARLLPPGGHLGDRGLVPLLCSNHGSASPRRLALVARSASAMGHMFWGCQMTLDGKQMHTRPETVDMAKHHSIRFSLL